MSGIDRDTIREALARAEGFDPDWMAGYPVLEPKQAEALIATVEALIRQARYDALTEAAEAIEAEIGPLVEVDTFAGGYDCCGCSTYRDIVDHAKRVVCSLRDQEAG